MKVPLREVLTEELILLRKLVGVRKLPGNKQSGNGRKRRAATRIVSYRALRHHRFYVESVRVCAQASRFVRERGSEAVGESYVSTKLVPTVERASIECINEIRLARGGTTAIAAALFAVMARLHLLFSEFAYLCNNKEGNQTTSRDVWQTATTNIL